MASLVTEVLMNTGLLEKEDLATRIDKVSTQIGELKAEISHALRQRYVDFIPSQDKIEKMHTRVRSLDTEMQDLGDKIQGDIRIKLRTSTSDVVELSKQLDQSNATIAVLTTLCKAHKDIKEFNTGILYEEYVQAADILHSLEGQLNMLYRSGYHEMKIVQSLKSEETVVRETLFFHLGESWSKTVMFKPVEGGKGKASKSIISPQLVVVQAEKFQCTLQAMETTGCLTNKLESFSKKLLEHVLHPIIRRADVLPATDSNPQKVTVTMVKSKVEQLSSIPSPNAVFDSILKVFEALGPPLLSHMVKRGDRGREAQVISIMSILGSLIWPSMSKVLIKDCLTPSIPVTSTELDDYKLIFDATRQFEEALQGLGFIAPDSHPLTDYGMNVNVHFANKRCQALLVEARRLMQQDLHNTVEVGGIKTSADEEGSAEEKNPLGPGLAAFPRCLITESVQKLLDMCKQTLYEASTSQEQCFQLFFTVRNMLQLFCEVVPHYHKASLSQLPRAAALHHNNCMYISHHLLTLGHRYQHTFPSPLSDGASIFVDLVPVFRKEAVTPFLAQMRSQRDLLLESVRIAEGFQRVADAENVTSANRAIKQVIHRWTHLKAVWAEVLPDNVYTKTMATLVNTVLMHVVEQITRLEDISADDASQLHLIFTKLKDETPDILKPSESEEPVIMEVMVKEWRQFLELGFILEASMQAIVDRWADGKGPLALAFTASTVKGLIRALFQNTDRRANALSKIKQTS
ncbi:centromere/kinetochore protein zw10 homolog [Strongylocentrotus purpuratus]|uniref:Centromere/kinetochore protein zw10 homolog n=1 Tax=Strongylocentrotus purpuratus TaxID=7668 RepID=A0A7M7TGZ0_STRPU|nr:centromere/kinetochore protein zw10 homolog [Strongylocentrotus purpuratus]